MKTKQSQSLFVHEIYESIQGESSYAGEKCIFIRLAGCNIRCNWCDTKDAFIQKDKLNIDEIINKLKIYKSKLVEVTGGEPLAQKETHLLLKQITENGYTTLLETNGFYPISSIHPAIKIILDIKCPDSGEADKLNIENLNITRNDIEYKFVLAGKGDFDYMEKIISDYKLTDKGIVLASPVFDKLSPKILSGWVLKSKFKIRLNLQLHKYIWGSGTKGV